MFARYALRPGRLKDMTAKNIQRAAVRMLYDPSLVERVYSQPDKAWPDLNLSVEERAWLVRPDRRRWRSDPARRQRSLQVIIEEFPVSVGLCLRDTSLVDLQAYFGSSIFHPCVNEDGSMVTCPAIGCVFNIRPLSSSLSSSRGLRAQHKCLRQLHDFDSCWTMCRHVDVVEVFRYLVNTRTTCGLGMTPTERIEALLAGCALSPGRLRLGTTPKSHWSLSTTRV